MGASRRWMPTSLVCGFRRDAGRFGQASVFRDGMRTTASGRQMAIIPRFAPRTVRPSAGACMLSMLSGNIVR
jgi:hypothetical protein